MIVTREIPPGSGRYRAVHVPDPSRHPHAAPGLDCALCGHPIGKQALHALTGDGRVLCGRCLDRPAHATLYPDCPKRWHDVHDHPLTTGTLAGIAAHLGLWP